MSFEGKKILITGASSGIGKETALYFDSLGAELVLVARRRDNLEEIARQTEQDCCCIPFDLFQVDDIEKIFMELKDRDIKLDGMIYCAGICNQNLIKSVSFEEMQRMLHINTVAFYMMCKYFSLPKYSNKGGSIVGLSSIASRTNEPGLSLYSLSKMGMNSSVKVMAKEFLRRGIRVNAVLPAQVRSKMANEENIWTEEELSEIKEYQPLGAIPIMQVVHLIEFLMSDQASFITGECIAISGGYKIRE